MSLYSRLAEYRKKLGINQTEMGGIVGTSRQTISQIERGNYSPSVDLAIRLAKACDTTVEELFYEEDDRENHSGKKRKTIKL